MFHVISEQFMNMLYTISRHIMGYEDGKKLAEKAVVRKVARENYQDSMMEMRDTLLKLTEEED